MGGERIDFERDGLLAGLTGEAREARAELLTALSDDGFERAELERAVEEGRLALLWAERRMSGVARYSPDQVAEEAGVDPELLARQRRALGRVSAGGADPELSEDDVAAAERVGKLAEVGLEPEAIEGMARVVAVAMSQFAAAIRQVMAESLVREGDTELDLARRFDELTKALLPDVGPLLDHAFRVHLRQQLRHVAIDVNGIGSVDADGEIAAVAFADLVGFTQLGEEVPPEELGRVTGRLDALARDVAVEPVRLVKMIGDAAMFSSTDSTALATAAFDLLDAAAAEGDEFPVMRAGMASGQVVQRAGDLFGQAVNLASRMTGIAYPGSLVVSEGLVEELEADFELSDAGRKRLKGIDDRVRIYRCRRPESSGEEKGKG